MGALLCSPSRQWSTASESLPPERPTSKRSPSLIMLKSAMALPTRPRSGLGMLGLSWSRVYSGAAAPRAPTVSSSLSSGIIESSGSQSSSPSVSAASPAAAAASLATPPAARASSTECTGLTEGPWLAPNMPSPMTSCGLSGTFERSVKATSAGSANHKRSLKAASSIGHFDCEGATPALPYASRSTVLAASIKAAAPRGAADAAPEPMPRDLSSLVIGPASSFPPTRTLESQMRLRSGVSWRCSHSPVSRSKV
mmetsp:Transcript_4266/g.10991  ORF Transcript_4266/g.10991 Transcript_4266/m.10991 type:complete len:254 (-) Transcript_4266:160-921(-)